MTAASKALGNAGEAHAQQLLEQRGYVVTSLATNAPTYDLRAKRGDAEFLVSVKVSRSKQHVRLGTRNSALGLVKGNFVFAFLPLPGQELSSFPAQPYVLLILPAELARDDSLRVHDAYWAAKGNGDRYSVMVKGYGSHHKAMWPTWMSYADAWHLLP